MAQRLVVQGHMYRGELSRFGEPHGVGVMKFPNGDSYDGDWFHGAMHGNGAYEEKKNGNVYRGPVVYEERHSKVHL